VSDSHEYLRVVTKPTVEPVTLADAKAHCRVDATTDDAYIATLIQTAREWVESYLDRQLIHAELEMSLEAFPNSDAEVDLPRPPMATASGKTAVSVTYTLATQATASLNSSTYRVDRYATPGRIYPLYGQNWPADRLEDENAIQVRWWAGYGESGTDVPAPIRHAILMLVGYWYERRMAADAVSGEVPFGVQSLLDSQRWGQYR
jgi:uncharacterized phiE125 gp8 family phage protein